MVKKRERGRSGEGIFGFGERGYWTGSLTQFEVRRRDDRDHAVLLRLPPTRVGRVDDHERVVLFERELVGGRSRVGVKRLGGLR